MASSDDRVQVNFDVHGPSQQHLDDLRRDLKAFDEALDITPHLDASALEPWPDPPGAVDTGEHDVIECNRPAHQDGHHGPECYGDVT